MCTFVILRRPGHEWPVLIAANRDESKSRPWDSPARHWPDRPETVAGRDRLADGSWLGLNDYGLTAAVLNRHGSLGPAPDKRSRGELVLDALEFAEAADAAQAMAALNPDAYRSFNLIIADNTNAFWIANSARTGKITLHAIPEGLSMLTSREINDTASERIRHYLPLFRAAPAPAPDKSDWNGWKELLGCRELGHPDDLTSAMCIDRGGDYGTVSSSLIALGAPEKRQDDETPDLWLFAPGAPDRTHYGPVAL